MSRLRFLLVIFFVLVTFQVNSSENEYKKSNRKQEKTFSIIVFPDTQIYSKDRPSWRRSSKKEVFMHMTQWVAARAKTDNIKFVLNMGDVVNDNDELYQWENANEAMSVLDGIVPYVMVIGNHDMFMGSEESPLDSIRNTTNFNHTFPYSRYQNEKWYGGRMPEDRFFPHDSYNNSYHFFSQGKLEFMIVSLEAGPTDRMLAWADSLISSYPKKRVIVATHSYMQGNDQRDKPGGFGYLPPNSNTGEEVWDKLIKKHKNIFLVLSGHIGNSDRHKGLLVSKGINGNTVYQQLNGEAYDGWLRILRFVPSEDKIYVESYSPWQPATPEAQLKEYEFSLPGFNRDSVHQYEMNYRMCGENK